MNSGVITCVLLALWPVAVLAETATNSAETSNVHTASAADGKATSNSSPALTGVRRPLYRLHKSDVVDLHFTFSPEFDQTLTVQPDGYVSPKAAGDVAAEGLTLPELRDSLEQAYAAVLRTPEISVILRDFEKPFFIAGGQVGHPGKYELRSPTTVTEAIAIAGGFTEQSKHSQVVLFRKVTDEIVESHVLNTKSMLAAKNLNEDLELRPGDMLFVPQNRISKIKKFLPVSSLSAFLSPAQF
ncbi:MAG TPA: polysaccharide biosynthesis/export family protein [Terriglobales bacterium]|nr:polysaccharide biosynthesis/export family protein [Terriglobales bacterium]